MGEGTPFLFIWEGCGALGGSGPLSLVPQASVNLLQDPGSCLLPCGEQPEFPTLCSFSAACSFGGQRVTCKVAACQHRGSSSGGSRAEVPLVAGALAPGHSRRGGGGAVSAFAFPPAHQPPSSPPGPSGTGGPPSRQLTEFHLTV